MASPLFGALMKMKRAYGHLRELQGSMKTYVESQPYTTAMEPVDPKPPYIESFIVRAKEQQAPPREEWGAMIGDIAHNLRSALDHLVWELSKFHQGGEPRTLTRDWRKIGFPIFTKQDSDSLARLGEMLWAIDPALKAEFEWLQPYTVPQAQEHPLAVLHGLWNVDKHRHVHLVVMQSLLTAINYIAAGKGHFEMTKGAFVELRHDAELFRLQRLEIVPGLEGMYVEVHSAPMICFAAGWPGFGYQVTEVLKNLYDLVAAVLIRFQSDLT